MRDVIEVKVKDVKLSEGVDVKDYLKKYKAKGEREIEFYIMEGIKGVVRKELSDCYIFIEGYLKYLVWDSLLAISKLKEFFNIDSDIVEEEYSLYIHYRFRNVTDFARFIETLTDFAKRLLITEKTVELIYNLLLL